MSTKLALLNQGAKSAALYRARVTRYNSYECVVMLFDFMRVSYSMYIPQVDQASSSHAAISQPSRTVHRVFLRDSLRSTRCKVLGFQLFLLLHFLCHRLVSFWSDPSKNSFSKSTTWVYCRILFIITLRFSQVDFLAILLSILLVLIVFCRIEILVRCGWCC